MGWIVTLFRVELSDCFFIYYYYLKNYGLYIYIVHVTLIPKIL